MFQGGAALGAAAAAAYWWASQASCDCRRQRARAALTWPNHQPATGNAQQPVAIAQSPLLRPPETRMCPNGERARGWAPSSSSIQCWSVLIGDLGGSILGPRKTIGRQAINNWLAQYKQVVAANLATDCEQRGAGQRLAAQRRRREGRVLSAVQF